MIESIRTKFADGHFEFSKHAVDQSIVRAISLVELIEAIETGIIIEDYTEDKYGLSWSNKTGQKTLYNGEYEKIR